MHHKHEKPGYYSPACKRSYVGNPVRTVAHLCEVCHKPYHECTCGHCHHHGEGLCAAVVDDANGRVYLYGNVQHENYHVPGGNCIAYTSVVESGFTNGKLEGDQFFEGVQDQNSCTLDHTPFPGSRTLVFLNGLKQREGEEHDYVLEGKTIHFNFYDLLETDVVEVMYEYEVE